VQPETEVLASSLNFSHLCNRKYTDAMTTGPKRYIHTILTLLIPAVLVFYAVSCATIVSPTGGPKDVTPPKLVSSDPKNLSTNFKGNKLTLNFSEYVDLKTPEKFLLISPPMGDAPDMKVKGRTIVIKVKDSLHINTTYNFYFGEAIVDITESNPVPNFNFAFSTGSEIDSLSLSGNVTDAFTRMPVKDALVMLYTDFTDSLPMKQIPRYVSRTTDDGTFRLNNLASGKYRVVALKDGNSDYLYNLPTEMIGFCSDSVEPYYSAIDIHDTNTVKTEPAIHKPVSIDMFPEPDSIQRILKSVIASRNRLSVAFRYPMETPGFRALNIPDTLPWSLQEWNPAHDTLNAWLLNKPDTLRLEVSEKGVVLDTIRISTTMKVTGRGKNNEAATRLKYITTVNGGVIGYNRPFRLTFANPVIEYYPDSLKLSIRTSKDTSIMTPVSRFTDSIHRHLVISHNWNTSDSYDLYIPKGSFIDIYSDTCDSTHVSFRITPLEEYGKFAVILNRQDSKCPVILQLLDEKGLVLNQHFITNEKRVDFGLLAPGKYSLKAIMDANHNGRWDTGKFLKKVQPETVLIHPKIFEVRTNWDLEETWDL